VLEPAQPIALGAVLHELATNACKYGALSVPAGRVEVNWSVTAKSGVDHLHLTWTERDGPQVKRSAKTRSWQQDHSPRPAECQDRLAARAIRRRVQHRPRHRAAEVRKRFGTGA